MNYKSIIYLFLLSAMIIGFFMFTGGVTAKGDIFRSAPTLSNFKAASPATIYAKLPFSILATNNAYKDKDCDDEYYTARDLVGSLIITQGTTVIDSSSFVFVSDNTTASKEKKTGTFVDTVIMNNAGTYTATAKFYDVYDLTKSTATAALNFTVGYGSEIPLTAGTYRLSTLTAACASSSLPPYTYTNTSASNTVVVNANLLTASMNMNIQMGSNALTLYPCLQDSSYNYNATGNFSIISEGGSRYFKIEYQNSGFVTFHYTFDGTNLNLNYSKNGSDYAMKFVKQ